jgi:elongation factor P--beta-lysine ligase
VEEEPEACNQGGWTDETFKQCLNFANNTAVGEFGRYTTQSEFFMMQWYRILCQYSGLSLTYRSDIFLAIDGIAQIFREVTGFTYKAGLFEEHVHSGLLWHVEGSNMPVRLTNAACKPPSWSWASLDGPVNMIFDRGSTNITTDLTAKVLRYQPHPKRASSAFAHAEDDVLMLEASCFNVFCRSSSNGGAPYSGPYLRMVIDIFDDRGICIGTGYLDRIPESTNARC